MSCAAANLNARAHGSGRVIGTWRHRCARPEGGRDSRVPLVTPARAGGGGALFWRAHATILIIRVVGARAAATHLAAAGSVLARARPLGLGERAKRLVSVFARARL